MNFDIPLLLWQRKVFADKSFIRVCVCGRGSGKTNLLGLEAFVAAMQGQRIIIASTTMHRAKGVLNEAKEIANKFNLGFFLKNDNYYRIGRNKDDTSNGRVFLASDVQPNNVRGENANMLIIDEAAFCKESFFKESLLHTTRLAKPSPRILIATTPLGTENWVSQMYMNSEKNKYASSHHADYLDNVLTSPEYKEYIKNDYVERNEMAFRRELLAEIVDYAENSPFTQFLKNIDFSDEAIRSNEPVRAGVDTAMGGDFTAVSVRQGNRLLALNKAKTECDDKITELVRKTLDLAGYTQADRLYYDSSGQGRLADHLFHQFSRRVIPVSFGASATDKRCVNLRSQCYIGLLDSLRNGITYGSQCRHLKDELIRDLMASHALPDESNQGRFGIVPKEQIKKAIKRSPDVGDAVALSFINYNPPDLLKAQENMRGIID